MRRSTLQGRNSLVTISLAGRTALSAFRFCYMLTCYARRHDQGRAPMARYQPRTVFHDRLFSNLIFLWPKVCPNSRDFQTGADELRT